MLKLIINNAPNYTDINTKKLLSKIVEIGTLVTTENDFDKLDGLNKTKRTIIIGNDLNDNDVNRVLNLSQTQHVFVLANKSTFERFEPHAKQIYTVESTKDIDLKFYSLIESKNVCGAKICIYECIKPKVLFAKPCYSNFKNKLIKRKNELVDKYFARIKLVIIQVGKNDSSSIYIKNKMKLADELDIDIQVINLVEDVTQSELLTLISTLNQDYSVHGIIVQKPLPEHINEIAVEQAIDPNKDIDCFNPINVGRLWNDDITEDSLIPCTALGIMKLLEYYQIDLKSKNVLVINRSNIVGKPLIPLLLNQDATVTVAHSKTRNLKEVCRNADVIISAIGKPKFINSEFIKQRQVLIDVGINRDEKNLVCGDFDFDEIKHLDIKISPVPLGVGQMTIMMLFNNLLICYERLQKR